SELGISNVDLSRLEDGIYTGSYEGGRWSNELEVKIKDHQIVGINIIDDLSFSLLEVREEIFQRLQEEQRLDIDVVSGSTLTSKAYIKAVEDALQ
ncbi:MAG: FMN-binding protein, partial [Halanaerobiaceae bacterium]